MHAEEAYRQKQNKAAVEAAAKEATETAEEARLMAVKQKAEDEAQAAAAAREAKPAPMKKNPSAAPAPKKRLLKRRPTVPQPNRLRPKR